MVKARQNKMHLPYVEGRVVTARATVDVLTTGKNILQKNGLKSWVKGYKRWVRRVSVNDGVGDLDGEDVGFDLVGLFLDMNE